MTSRRLKLISLLAGAGLAALLLGANAPVADAAGRSSTCHGGSVAPGTYRSLVIAGACAVDSGSVTVLRNLTVRPGADLYAAFGGSDLTVHGNLNVLKGRSWSSGASRMRFPVSTTRA